MTQAHAGGDERSVSRAACVADWGRPQNALMWLASLGIRLLDGAETTGDNLGGKLPALMEEAGFISVAEMDRLMTAFGTLALYRAAVPSAAPSTSPSGP